jgi:hypothetical protein
MDDDADQRRRVEHVLYASRHKAYDAVLCQREGDLALVTVLIGGDHE